MTRRSMKAFIILATLAALVTGGQHLTGGEQNEPANIKAAIQQGRLDIVQAMVARDPTLLEKKPGRDTPLHEAAGQNQPEIVEFLVKAGMDLNSRGINGYTPLHHAAGSMIGWSAASQLIELGADPDARTPSPLPGQAGISPLDRAAYVGHIDLVRQLVEKGATIREDPGRVYYSALHWACHPYLAIPYQEDPEYRGNRQVIRFLVSKLGNPDVRTPAGETPLHLAAVYGAADTVEFLLEEYPDIDLRAEQRSAETPLHFAVRVNTDDKHSDHRRVIRLLYEKVGTDFRSSAGTTPLHSACRWGHIDTVRFLLKEFPRIDVNARSATGKTALHEAVLLCNATELKIRAEIVRLLLEHGAENLPDNRNFTPYDDASRFKLKPILNVFDKR